MVASDAAVAGQRRKSSNSRPPAGVPRAPQQALKPSPPKAAVATTGTTQRRASACAFTASTTTEAKQQSQPGDAVVAAAAAAAELRSQAKVGAACAQQGGNGSDGAGTALFQKQEYAVGDVVVFEQLDETHVWCWAVGRVTHRVSPRVVEITTWEPRGGSSAPGVDAQRVSVEEMVEQVCAQSKAAQAAMEEADDLACGLRETAKYIADRSSAAETELAKARPLLDEAQRAVSSISMEALRELRSYPQPPAIVMTVLQCVTMLIAPTAKKEKTAASSAATASLPTTATATVAAPAAAAAAAAPESRKSKGNGPRRSTGGGTSSGSSRSALGEGAVTDAVGDQWKAIKKIVMKESFLATVRDLDPASTAEEVRAVVSDRVAQRGCTVEKALRASKAAGPLLQWVLAQLAFADAMKQVRPQLDEVEKLRAAADANAKKLDATCLTSRQLEASIGDLKRRFGAAVLGASSWAAVQYSVGPPPAGGVLLKDWLPAERAPRPALHSAILFCVERASQQ